MQRQQWRQQQQAQHELASGQFNSTTTATTTGDTSKRVDANADADADKQITSPLCYINGSHTGRGQLWPSRDLTICLLLLLMRFVYCSRPRGQILSSIPLAIGVVPFEAAEGRRRMNYKRSFGCCYLNAVLVAVVEANVRFVAGAKCVDLRPTVTVRTVPPLRSTNWLN